MELYQRQIRTNVPDDYLKDMSRWSLVNYLRQFNKHIKS